jgi:hypothetical protein
MGQRFLPGFQLLALGDLPDRRKILNVDASGKVGFIPINLGQNGVCPQGNKRRHFATGERGVTRVLTVL